jgi:hypothetical protein
VDIRRRVVSRMEIRRLRHEVDILHRTVVEIDEELRVDDNEIDDEAIAFLLDEAQSSIGKARTFNGKIGSWEERNSTTEEEGGNEV